MATISFSTFRPATFISAAPSSNHPNGNSLRSTKPRAAASSSASWWTPLFGWSSDPDYISNPGETSGPPPESDKSRSRFAPGCFTEEKAKQLRMKTLETASFHDIMYHSAIASRLASDVSGH